MSKMCLQCNKSSIMLQLYTRHPLPSNSTLSKRHTITHPLNLFSKFSSLSKKK